MKILFINCILGLIVVLTACTKKYDCKCTTTLSRDGYYPNKTETIVPVGKNSSKKKAKDICYNTSLQMQATSSQLFPDYIKVSTVCIVKDY